MAEVRSTASRPGVGAGARGGTGLELRLERGGAHVLLAAPAPMGGLLVQGLDLAVPDVVMPFDVGAGPYQFQNRLCDLCRLDVLAEPDAISAVVARLDLAEFGLASLEVVLRDGFAEATGRLAGGPAFTLRLGLVPGFERGVTVIPYAPRLFGPSTVPAAFLPHLAARALSVIGPAEDPLPLILRRVLVARGWKVPREGAARLAGAAVTPAGVRLVWDRDTPPAAPVAVAPDLLAAVEGARAFADAEAQVAAGEWDRAREAYLSDQAAASHPFAAERLLSLLCLDERFHDEALDLAAEWLERQPGFAPALAAEAWIRAVRGENERAALALATLAEQSVARGERLAAAAAAEAALALPGAGREAASRAVDAALAVRRDHVPALRALAALARDAGDKGAQLRAARRLLAYAPTDAEKARAHAELGELLLDKDPPAARLHLDRSLRLAPADPQSLATLARACTAAGEHLRAVRALDRLRELRLEAGDRAEAARLALQAGELWDLRLGHVENALLRYREAADLGPGAAEAWSRAAACAERLGRWAEAADHHAAALSALDRSAPDAAAQAAAHHLALADVAEHRLDDPGGAATHLEAALAGGLPPDAARLTRLAALYRRLGRPAELLLALDRLAPLTAPAAARAALLAEAGELALGPLHRPDLALDRHAAALALDPTCRPALDGQAAAAAALGDASAERDALARLVPLARDRDEAAALLDRQAGAADRAGDLVGAAQAVAAARRAAPSRERLAAAVALARRVDDAPALAGLLDELARAAAAAGDARAAAAAFRERSELLEEGDPALALAALSEARALQPGDAGLLRRQATLATRAGDPGQALGALRALLAGHPADGPELELAAARAALAAGQASEAARHAEQAYQAGALGALDLLDEALQRSGDEAGRAALLDRLGRHLEAAARHEQAGDQAAALLSYERAAAVEATATEGLRHLVRLRARAGDQAGTAATLLALARRLGGREGAEVAMRAHALSPSEAALDAAVAADPGFAPARAERALRRAEADPAGALADAEAALSGEGLEPTRRPALLRASARLATAAGDPELARRRLAAFCQLGTPGDADLVELADLHRAAGDEEGLAAALERRLTTAPPETALPLRLELAPLLQAHGRDAEAVTRWREALSLDRTTLPALRALLDPARAAVLHDGEREALLALLARHEGAEATERASAWEELGRTREARGDGPGALAALAAAARLRGDDDEGLERRAEEARRAGDAPTAATLWLRRARRAVARGEVGAAERLVEAGQAALEAGLDGEGLAALGDALALRPEPEAARGALSVLAERAARAGDEGAERAALAPLVPLLPTGERPARLVRLSTLRLAAGDTAGALAAAEEARVLAPRDLATTRQARAAAEAAGDQARVAERLADEAALDEERAGPLLLDRARLLWRLSRHEEADDAYGEAQRRLRPDMALAAEQSRRRRQALPTRRAAEPVEAFARRTDEPANGARASLVAAALWLQDGDRGAALRCARRAFGRRREAPAEAGPLLARLLYEQGAFAEALVLHRTLLAQGFAGVEDGEVVTLCRQLAELASEAGETELALAALDRLLALRPQDAEAARQRLALDPDRRRAVQAAAEVAGRVRSAAARAGLLGQAGQVALAELRDRRLGERLFREARAEAAHLPGLPAELERRRAVATRGADLGPEALLGALHDAAEAALAGGERGSARALLEEAVAEAGGRGMRLAAARDLAALERLDAADGDPAGAARHARAAADLLADAGQHAEAAAALRRVLEVAPGDQDTLERLAAVARARGEEGAADLADALTALATQATPGHPRAAILLELASVQAGALGDDTGAEASLLAALEEEPGHPAAEAALSALLTRTGRGAERARRLLDQARDLADPAARAAAWREAATLLLGSSDPADRSLGADALVAVAQEAAGDPVADRAAADALVAAGRRDEAVPHLAAVVRADPDDDHTAAELVQAYADRPRDRAELFLARAAHATGAVRAGRLLEASRAFLAAREPARAAEATREAFQAWPADDAAFRGALALSADDADRLDGVLALRAQVVPEDAAGCHRARADVLFAFGLAERAIPAYRAALALDPEDPAALAALGACLAAVRGPEQARETDRRLCDLAVAQPGRVPASLEAEARYRLGLVTPAEAPAAEVRADLERAVWLAPGDARADTAWAALAEAHLRLGEPAAALAAARARAERALTRGDEAAERAALEAGVALAGRQGDAGPDAAALLDALLACRVEAAEPVEELVPLAIRAAAAWRALGDEGRARAALDRAGVVPTRPPPAPDLHAVELDEAALEAEPPSERVALEDVTEPGGGPASRPESVPVVELAPAAAAAEPAPPEPALAPPEVAPTEGEPEAETVELETVPASELPTTVEASPERPAAAPEPQAAAPLVEPVEAPLGAPGWFEPPPADAAAREPEPLLEEVELEGEAVPPVSAVPGAELGLSEVPEPFAELPPELAAGLEDAIPAELAAEPLAEPAAESLAERPPEVLAAGQVEPSPEPSPEPAAPAAATPAEPEGVAWPEPPAETPTEEVALEDERRGEPAQAPLAGPTRPEPFEIPLVDVSELGGAPALEAPASVAAGYLASAEALAQAGAPPAEVRAALDLACDADPDDAAPWRALAAHEASYGDPLAAARASLAVSIRTEGDEAAGAALEAARRFEEAGRHAEAARAYRAANVSRRRSAPAALILAEDALALGDLDAAGEHLRLVEPQALGPATRAGYELALARVRPAGAEEPPPVVAAPAAAPEPPLEEILEPDLIEPEPVEPPVLRVPPPLPTRPPAVPPPLPRATTSPWVPITETALEPPASAPAAELGQAAAPEAPTQPDLALPPEADETVRFTTLPWAAAPDLGEEPLPEPPVAPPFEPFGEALVVPPVEASLEAVAAPASEPTTEPALELPAEPAPESPPGADQEELRFTTLPWAQAPDLGEGPLAEPFADPGVEPVSGPSEPASEPPLELPVEQAVPSPLEPPIELPPVELPPETPVELADGSGDLPIRFTTLPWAQAPDLGEDPFAEPALDLPVEPSLPPPAELAPPPELPSPVAPPDAPLEVPPAPEPAATPEPTFEPTAEASVEPLLEEFEAQVGPAVVTPPDAGFSFEFEPPGEGAPLEVAELEEDFSAFYDPEADPAGQPPSSVPPPPEAEAETAPALEAAPLPAVPEGASPEPGVVAPERPAAEDAPLRPVRHPTTPYGVDFEAPVEPTVSITSPWEPIAEPIEPLAEPARAAPPEAAVGPEAAPLPAPEPLPEPGGSPFSEDAARLLDLVRQHAAAGDRPGLWAMLPEAEPVLGEAALRPFAASIGRAALDAGHAQAAWRWLSLAAEDDPDELTLARDRSRAAERIGRHADEVALGARCAEAIAEHDPLAAAARFRHFARVQADKLQDLDGAIAMIERSLELVPGDPDSSRELWTLWARRPETAARALEAWLDAARRDPSDASALGAVADLATELSASAATPDEAVRLLERAHLAASLAAFVAPGRHPPPARPARTVPDRLRDRIAAPGSVGPLARLLGLLAPYLESLFPADLARRGATGANRLAADQAPRLAQALSVAARILSPRSHAVFVVERPGLEILVENTQPPALVVPAGVEALPEASIQFLAARTLDLVGRGWALIGKFAPRDVGILAELACRFAGVAPPSMGLPSQRADAFLEALARAVPPTVAERARELGPAAAEELARADLKSLASALRRTAGRVALLACGDPEAALQALRLSDRQGGTLDADAALAQADLRDLALLALSEPFLDLRVAVIG